MVEACLSGQSSSLSHEIIVFQPLREETHADFRCVHEDEQMMGKFPKRCMRKSREGKNCVRVNSTQPLEWICGRNGIVVCSPAPSVSEEEEFAGGVGTCERTESPARPTTT